MSDDLLAELEAAASQRRAGPTAPFSVRSAGDEGLAKMLSEAVSTTGREPRATHGFHTYPAGMHPDCARIIIEACPGAVHDPFCGGGTVLVEAVLNNRQGTGTDLSPIALLVARARCSGSLLATPLRAASRKLTAAARLRTPTTVPEVCKEWYEPHVAEELGRLRDGIALEGAEVRPLLEAVFSSICIKASYRESDTSNNRVTMHRPPGTTAILFHKKARELGRMLDEMPAAPEFKVRMADARRVGPPEETGLVLTSPPYPGVYDYVPMQQLRMAWLGLEPGWSPGAEVGSRRSFRAMGRAAALKKWREDTEHWINTQASLLPPGGRLAIVVGDGLVGDKLVDALSPTVEAMRDARLKIVARASADRPDYARDAIRTEHIVLGERPGG